MRTRNRRGEILEDLEQPLDYLFVPIGGGGLSSGLSIYFKALSPETKIIGAEPAGAPAMKKSIAAGKPITLAEIDKFVDGAAVKRIGDYPFEICRGKFGRHRFGARRKSVLHHFATLQSGCDCRRAGRSTFSRRTRFYADKIKGKNVCCIVSGSNNDIDRLQEIKERSLIYEELKHYFIITFPQRAGALREFLAEVLGPDDDITLFEYTKKSNKEVGSAIVGIELKRKTDYDPLRDRMEKKGFPFITVNDNPALFDHLI